MRNAQLAELGRKTPKQAHVMDQASSQVTRRLAMRPSAWPRPASYISSALRVASKNYPAAPASTPPSPAPPGRPGQTARACRPPRSGRAARPPSTGAARRSLRYKNHLVSIAPCGGKVAIYEPLVKFGGDQGGGNGRELNKCGILTSVCHWDDKRIPVNGYTVTTTRGHALVQLQRGKVDGRSVGELTIVREPYRAVKCGPHNQGFTGFTGRKEILMVFPKAGSAQRGAGG
ncbi:hypothetical protein V493_02858 [Pseudogymnoascus sp. VKM F-4281 (FW-2241)]|nr:hypothetical protein V493_02858 [Pseudogymnoascus sp. VKM F-4281 (FW-2241)]